MKRYYIFLVSLICSISAMAQENSLSVSKAEAFVTENFEMAVSLNNSTEITSLQCDIILPEGVMLNDKPTLTNRAQASHTIGYNVTRDGVLKVVIHSSKSEPILGNSGDLFTLPLTSDEDCESGEKMLRLEKIFMATPNGVEKDAKSISGSFTLNPSPVSLNKNETTILLGCTERLSLSFASNYSLDKTIMWSSSKERVAKVSQEGEVTAMSVGETVITATVANGIKASCIVTVSEVPAERVVLSETSIQMTAGYEKALTATVYPDNTTNKQIKWTSSNESCATVNQAGKIKTLGLGKTTITAACGSAYATCEVEVLPIVLSTTNLNLRLGEKRTLSISYCPPGVPQQATFESSDESIARILPYSRATCYVEGVGLGTTKITITYGDISAECDVTVSPVVASSVTMTAYKGYMNVEDSCQFKASIYPNNTTDKTLTWSSSDSTVLVVDGKASVSNDTGEVMVTAIGAGTATITATAVGGAKAERQITVRSIAKEIILDKTEITLQMGRTESLRATVLPTDAVNKSVTWTSSDENVAVVNGSGYVTGVNIGTATITATCGKATASCKVTVTQIFVSSVTGIFISSISHGQTRECELKVYPDNAADKTLTLTSSNPNIVEVVDVSAPNDEGKVIAKLKGVNPGKATITISAVGGYTTSFDVTVNEVKVLNIDIVESLIKLYEGDETQFTVKVYPENATDKTLTWESADTSVATVSETGLVKAVGAGQTSIIAHAVGGAKDNCTVYVFEKPKSISLSSEDIVLLTGESKSLTAKIRTQLLGEVKWSSSDESVAKVTKNGSSGCVVSAVGSGEAIITASLADVSATCKVTVKNKQVNDISFENIFNKMNVGETKECTAVVDANDSWDIIINWTSSNTSVVEVLEVNTSADGKTTAKLKALKAGTSTIRVTASDGYTKEFSITVTGAFVSTIIVNSFSQMTLGETRECSTARVGPDNATDKTLIWTSSDSTVVDILEVVGPMANGNSKATLKAVGEGKATITITAVGGYKTQFTITVSDVYVDFILVNDFSSMKYGETKVCTTAKVGPDNATNKTLTWTSSDSTVVDIVDVVSPMENGNSKATLKAVGVGKATITLTAVGGYKKSFTITVSDIYVNSVSLNIVSSMVIGETKECITTKVSPDNATNKTLTWTSSNTSVVEIVDVLSPMEDGNSKATLKAVGVGTAMIKISAVGGYSKSFSLTVKSIAVTGIKLNKTTMSIEKGEEEQLTVAYTPTNATDKTVTWESSDTDKATVSEDGVVKAVGLGTAVITAKHGNLKAQCTVTVKAPTVKSVTLNASELDLYVGESFNLIATLAPEDASDKRVAWKSMNNQVALVNSSGVVKGFGEGTTKVTATAASGVKAECMVTVRKKEQDINWTQDFNSVAVGDVIELTATATSELPVTYTVTKGEDLAAIEGNILTIKGAGDIEVCASQDGNNQFKAAEPIIKQLYAIDTAIKALHADADSIITITNLSGFTVFKGKAVDMPKHLPKDIYIFRCGAKAVKVIAGS